MATGDAVLLEGRNDFTGIVQLSGFDLLKYLGAIVLGTLNELLNGLGNGRHVVSNHGFSSIYFSIALLISSAVRFSASIQTHLGSRWNHVICFFA